MRIYVRVLPVLLLLICAAFHSCVMCVFYACGLCCLQHVTRSARRGRFVPAGLASRATSLARVGPKCAIYIFVFAGTMKIIVSAPGIIFIVSTISFARGGVEFLNRFKTLPQKSGFLAPVFWLGGRRLSAASPVWFA